VALLAVGLVSSLAAASWSKWLETRFQRAPWPVHAVVLAVVVLAAAQVSGSNIAPFIYFRF
jgi:hypothetical protein